MKKLGLSAGGFLLMGASVLGLEAYREERVDDINEQVIVCYEKLEGDEATECADTAEWDTGALLGLAETASLIGAVAFGAMTYRTIRDQDKH